MTNAQKIIDHCQNMGLSLSLVNGSIDIETGHEGITDQDWQAALDQLKGNKQAVVDRLEELEARAAVLEYEGGLTKLEAEQQAFEELAAVGADDQAARVSLENEQIEQWRVLIQSMPSPNSQDGAKLVKYALAFLDSPLSLEAVSLDWDALSLFGVFHGQEQPTKRRHDAMGLIPSFAWSKISGNLSGIKPRLESLDGERAVIEYKAINDRSGSKLFRNRKISSPDQSIVFWENEHLTGGA